MGASKHIDAVTIFAKLRERYNETNSVYLSQAALAKKFGVCAATIRPCLKNDEMPNGERLFRQSRRFDAAILCAW